MFENYLKIAFRNFLQHKIYALINILGLAIGIACCMIILLFVGNELNYDRFHENGERIYRVLRQSVNEGRTQDVAVTSGPYADALLTDYPVEIEAVTRVFPNDGLVTFRDKSFREERFYFADANFFEFFSYPLWEGDPRQVLKDPHSIVISREMAEKYFGDADPLGQVLTYEKRYEFRVSGIFEDSPGNSHLSFDFVASMDPLREKPWFDEWWNNFLFTYVLLAKGSSAQGLEARLPGFMDKYFGDHFRETGLRMGLRLEALGDIYFNHETAFDWIPHGDRKVVYIFSVIAFLTLIIACINFMNLATAKSTARATEVGLRKVMGAYRQMLVIQFIGEAIILTLLAMGLAVALVEILLPYCNTVFRLNLALDYRDWRLPLLLLGGALTVGALSGSYPAFFLSAFQPAAVLKGKLPHSSPNPHLRRILVVLQFSASIFLMICTAFIIKQLDYVSEKKLGFNKERVVLIRVNNREIYEQREIFKNRLLPHEQIAAVSGMSGEPGGFHDNYSFNVEGISDGARRIRTVFSDFDYCRTLNLEVVAGRDFSEEYRTDDRAMLLNETAVHYLGWTNREALGKQLTINLLDSLSRTVIGVVRDFHFTSLKQKIEPLAISIAADQRVIAIKIRPGNIPRALALIEDAWTKAAPGYPFEYHFLDESFDALYKAERKQQQIITLFAIIAIFIACLGLFGLATFAAEQRTKEIGIRKVLGASVTGIVMLLSKDFLKLLLIAFVIAAPTGYYATHLWLRDFAYRIDPDAWTFLLSGILTILIALGTVSFQAVRAALSNPVKVLRYE